MATTNADTRASRGDRGDRADRGDRGSRVDRGAGGDRGDRAGLANGTGHRPQDPSAKRSTDRLVTALFIAALVHGVLILGVTFTSWPSPDTNALPSLKVTLVVDTGEVADVQDAEWLAQANSEGGGARADGVRPTTTLAAEQAATVIGDPFATDVVDGRPREAAVATEELVTRSDVEREIAAVPRATEVQTAETESRAALLDRAAPETLALEIDERAEMPNAEDRDGPPALSAEQSILAAYLDEWRRRVERIGTLNFPDSLTSRHDLGRPTLEVAIGPDGSLTDIVVRKSSGDGAVDQAALTILRLAAPFDPLPAEIRARYDVLRFAYEWDFAGESATVETPASP